jgi:hypothetical protein
MSDFISAAEAKEEALKQKKSNNEYYIDKIKTLIHSKVLGGYTSAFITIPDCCEKDIVFKFFENLGYKITGINDSYLISWNQE